jgi:hypothetical protein
MPAICSLMDGDGKRDAGLQVQQEEWRPKAAANVTAKQTASYRRVWVDTLGDRFIGHAHARPDRLKQCVLGHDPARAFNEATQDIEALGPQLNIELGGRQTSARHVEDEALELVHL